MNKFSVTFILLILAMLGTAMIQIFQPQLLGNVVHLQLAFLAAGNRFLESGYSAFSHCRQHKSMIGSITYDLASTDSGRAEAGITIC